MKNWLVSKSEKKLEVKCQVSWTNKKSKPNQNKLKKYVITFYLFFSFEKYNSIYFLLQKQIICVDS